MSDSDSSEQVENKTQLKMQGKLRDLLEKGKTICPFYDDDTLLTIYKECFSTDQIFINKLQIIAKNSKQAEADGQNGWIQSRSHLKQTNTNPQRSERRAQRIKYNFLEDNILLERARKFNPERQRLDQEKKRHIAKDRIDNQNRNNRTDKPRYQERGDKEENRPQKAEEKKMKYKAKEQTNKETKSTVTASKTNQVHEEKIKEAPKAVQKKEKFVEKKVQKVSDKKEKAAELPVPKKQPQIVKQPEVVQKQNPPQETKKPVKVQYKQKEEVKEPIATKTSYAEKPQAPVAQPVKTNPQPQPLKPSVQVEPKVAVKEVKPKAEVESPTKVVKVLSEEVKSQFNKSCNSNTFVLKFIQPSQRLQKVSYIRLPDGKFDSVKTREVLPARN